MSITNFAAILLGYEGLAMATHRPTWTDLTARRSPFAIPVVFFWIWLAVHLWRAECQIPATSATTARSPLI